MHTWTNKFTLSSFCSSIYLMVEELQMFEFFDAMLNGQEVMSGMM